MWSRCWQRTMTSSNISMVPWPYYVQELFMKEIKSTDQEQWLIKSRTEADVIKLLNGHVSCLLNNNICNNIPAGRWLPLGSSSPSSAVRTHFVLCSFVVQVLRPQRCSLCHNCLLLHLEENAWRSTYIYIDKNNKLHLQRNCQLIAIFIFPFAPCMDRTHTHAHTKYIEGYGPTNAV